MHSWRAACIGLLLIVLVACTAAPAVQETFILADAQPSQRVTLEVTLSDARDQNGVRRDGTLSITSINDGQLRMVHITSTDAVAPIWLTTVENNAVFVATDQERRVVDGTCTRDASGFPPVSIRDIFGPLQGFQRQGDIWQSTQGGTAWSEFSAQAVTTTQHMLTQMTGHGRGKVLLPGGDVISADMTWRYMIDAYPVTVVAPEARCESQGFTGISFPEAFGTSTSMGGALLFRTAGTLTSLRDALMTHWQRSGLEPAIRAENQQSITIEVVIDAHIVRAFLVHASTDAVDITVIRIAQ